MKSEYNKQTHPPLGSHMSTPSRLLSLSALITLTLFAVSGCSNGGGDDNNNIQTNPKDNQKTNIVTPPKNVVTPPKNIITPPPNNTVTNPTQPGGFCNGVQCSITQKCVNRVCVDIPESTTCTPACKLLDKCIGGNCVTPPVTCTPSICAANQYCDGKGTSTSCQTLPQNDECAAGCPADKVCVDKKCVDPGPATCDPKCSDGSYCRNGACVPDTTCPNACAQGEYCDLGKCVAGNDCETPCAGDQYCNDKKECVARQNCYNIQCDYGEICDDSGQCVKDNGLCVDFASSYQQLKLTPGVETTYDGNFLYNGKEGRPNSCGTPEDDGKYHIIRIRVRTPSFLNWSFVKRNEATRLPSLSLFYGCSQVKEELTCVDKSSTPQRIWLEKPGDYYVSIQRNELKGLIYKLKLKLEEPNPVCNIGDTWCDGDKAFKCVYDESSERKSKLVVETCAGHCQVNSSKNSGPIASCVGGNSCDNAIPLDGSKATTHHFESPALRVSPNSDFTHRHPDGDATCANIPQPSHLGFGQLVTYKIEKLALGATVTVDSNVPFDGTSESDGHNEVVIFQTGVCGNNKACASVTEVANGSSTVATYTTTTANETVYLSIGRKEQSSPFNMSYDIKITNP